MIYSRGQMMKKVFGTSLILLVVFLECGICAQPTEPIFSVPADRIQVDLPPINPSVVLRQRLVTVRSDLLGRVDEPTLFLNPFDDVHLEAAWGRTDKNANGSFAWLGHIVEAPSSEVILVWDGSKMAASITMMNRKYTVRHLKDDLHLVRELDLAFLQPASPVLRSESITLQAVPSGFETDVLDLVNQERAAQNLLPLTWDNRLHEAARGHSGDMATNNYFSHTSLDGRTFVDRIEDAGYPWSAAGENIAAGYSTPQAVVNGWMNSAGHRQNILSSAYCDLGVGYAYNQSSAYDHYWTQDFGRRTGVAVCLNVSNQPPSGSFIATPLSGLPSLVVQFDASGSVDPEGGLLSFYWNFGDGQTGSGKIAAHTYTEAGLYTVTLTVTDSGGASDTFVRVNYIEIETPPGEGVCDELLGDFGSPYGLWHFDRVGGWQQLNTVDPGLMVALDVDNDTQDELAVAFSGYGLWIYDPGNTPANRWKQLNPIVPEAMIRLGNGIACGYGAAHGLWTWSQAGGWRHLNSVAPGLMAAVDIDADGQDELTVAFSGYGVYTYDPIAGWLQINATVPEGMIRLGNGIACDYGTAYGLWTWTQLSGWRHLNSVDPGLMMTVDLDDDQQEELVVNFTSYGLHSYDPIAGWTLLNVLTPNAMAPANLY